MTGLTRGLLKFYKLVPVEKKDRLNEAVIFQKRILIGSSDHCNLSILHPSVSVIHAVIEVSDSGGKVYDMNSTAGTKVNGNKIICQEVKVGDKISFGDQEFIFQDFERAQSQLPPVMSPGAGVETAIPDPVPSPPSSSSESVTAMPAKSPPVPPPAVSTGEGKVSYVEKSPPTGPSKNFQINPQDIIVDKSSGGDDTPYISYPLSKDPNTELSEYIFEDADYIHPIFKWTIDVSAAEVIILHKDRIFSVDYLPARDKAYYLHGLKKGKKGKEGVEYPYLRRDESIPFLRVENHQVYIEDNLGYDGLLISDAVSNNPENFKQRPIKPPITLGPQDILKLQKNDLQIFVRNTQAPPKIKPAPLFRRDNLSRKYFVIMSLFFLFFLGVLSQVDINKEMEKEKQPERLASIIYNRKKYVYKKTKTASKTATAKEKVIKKDIAKPKRELKPKPAKKAVAPKKVSAVKPKPKPKPTPKPTPKPKPPKKVAKVGVKKNVVKPKPTRKAAPKAAPAKKVARKKPSPTKARSPQKPTRRPTPKPSPTPEQLMATRLSSKFSGKVSKLLAKGGGTPSVQADDTASTSAEITSGGVSGSISDIKSTSITQGEVGSLEGATTGSLDQTTGTQNLVDKKNVAIAGIPEDAVVIGSYDASQVADILRQHLDKFRYCYQKELDRDNRVAGKIDLDFQIGASGRVNRAGVAQSQLPASVEGCVVKVLKRIQFPPPLGGGVVGIKQPMSFEERRG